MNWIWLLVAVIIFGLFGIIIYYVWKRVQQNSGSGSSPEYYVVIDQEKVGNGYINVKWKGVVSNSVTIYTRRKLIGLLWTSWSNNSIINTGGTTSGASTISVTPVGFRYQVRVIDDGGNYYGMDEKIVN